MSRVVGLIVFSVEFQFYFFLIFHCYACTPLIRIFIWCHYIFELQDILLFYCDRCSQWWRICGFWAVLELLKITETFGVGADTFPAMRKQWTCEDQEKSVTWIYMNTYPQLMELFGKALEHLEVESYWWKQVSKTGS